jgi:hypothetical protein
MGVAPTVLRLMRDGAAEVAGGRYVLDRMAIDGVEQWALLFTDMQPAPRQLDLHTRRLLRTLFDTTITILGEVVSVSQALQPPPGRRGTGPSRPGSLTLESVGDHAESIGKIADAAVKVLRLLQAVSG